MSRKVPSFAKDADPSEFRAFVRDSSMEELEKLVRSSVYKPSAPNIFNDIFQAFSDSDVCQLKRRKVVESTLKILEKANVSTGHIDAIVNRIILDIPRYSKQHLIKLVDFCIAGIRDRSDQSQSWKDLLPVLLEALENEKYITHVDTEVSGVEYKSLIVKQLCDLHWNVDLLPSLAKMFGDMALDKTSRGRVLEALCRALPDLSPDQVPPFVYQALKLCKERDNQYFLDVLCNRIDACRSKAISASNEGPFDDIGEVSIKEIQDVESTVLYHIYNAAQLNHESMKDFVRYLKSVSSAPEYTLQPFRLAMLLSISAIYEDQIFEILKSAIVKSSQDKEARERSAWLRRHVPSPCNVIDNVRRVIGSGNRDRHLVLKGLTSLAFMLMSTDQKLKNNATAVWNVGGEIIREIMKKRHETVAVVLRELVEKIITGSVPTTHYTDCLKYACHELSAVVLDHQVWIMTLLERLLFLPSTVAGQVLYAIFPLMHVSPNIRENLLLTLRKALYRKGTSKRQMAVTGFLEMLKYSKVHSLGSFRLSQRCNSSAYAISSSSRSALTQVTLEYNAQQERPTPDCDKTLCHEILDILKKTFTYEFQVRLHLYEGLYDTVTRNPEITEIVLDMLLSHFSLYINADDTTLPPVKFELCTDIQGTEVVVQEPIAELIFAMQKIYVGTFTRKSNTFDKLHDILEFLCTRMAATELEHLNLEHGADLIGDFPKSHLKLKHLNAVIGIYEALMAFRIGEWSKGNVESLRDISDLFNRYTKAVDFIKMQSVKMKKAESGKAKKDKDVHNATRKLVKLNNIKVPRTIMDLDAVYQGLRLLYSNREPRSSKREGANIEENSEFSRYILETCQQLLQRTTLFTNNTTQTQNHRDIDTYIEVGGLLYKYFLMDLRDALENDDAAAAAAAAAVLALQCFKEISCSMCTLFSSGLPRFLDTIFESKSKNATSTDVNARLQEIVSSLKTYLIASLVDETDDDARKKVPFLLIQIFEHVAQKIDFEKCPPEKIIECSREMAETKDIRSPIVPAVVQFLLRVEEYTGEYGETLNEICLELCEKLGTIDGRELTTTERYKIIRQDTVGQIYNALNSYIKEKLNNTSWLLMRVKAEDAIARAPGTVDQVLRNNLREKERNLCKQLSYLAQVLHTLANASIEPGPSTDVTFKNFQYLYHLLGNLTKYFYAKSTAQNVAYQTVKFIQVVQLAGKPLKSAFYNLVTHVEETQNKLHSKSDSHAQRNKILKETKIIPRVVYEIEQFNKEVLLLGKRTGVPLENYMKHSVTRDFRIKNPQLVEDLEKMDTSLLTSPNLDEDTENVSRETSSNESSPGPGEAAAASSSSRKRRKTED